MVTLGPSDSVSITQARDNDTTTQDPLLSTSTPPYSTERIMAGVNSTQCRENTSKVISPE